MASNFLSIVICASGLFKSKSSNFPPHAFRAFGLYIVFHFCNSEDLFRKTLLESFALELRTLLKILNLTHVFSLSFSSFVAFYRALILFVFLYTFEYLFHPSVFYNECLSIFVPLFAQLFVYSLFF